MQVDSDSGSDYEDDDEMELLREGAWLVVAVVRLAEDALWSLGQCGHGSKCCGLHSALFSVPALPIQLPSVFCSPHEQAGWRSWAARRGRRSG